MPGRRAAEQRDELASPHRPPPQAEASHYHTVCAGTLLCSTAKLIVEWQRWVISDRSIPRRRSRQARCWHPACACEGARRNPAKRGHPPAGLVLRFAGDLPPQLSDDRIVSSDTLQSRAGIAFAM